MTPTLVRRRNITLVISYHSPAIIAEMAAMIITILGDLAERFLSGVEGTRLT
jgi:hypothetical protein